MDDPNNSLEITYPSFPEMMRHMDSIRNPKYPKSLDDELAHWLYENIKPEILIRLHSCKVMETHLQRDIPLEAKKTMCIQRFKVRFFCHVIPIGSDMVVRNSDLHRPWCMQEWVLPSLGLLCNVFMADFDVHSLIKSLKEYAQEQKIEVNKNTFPVCYVMSSDVFCELLFMYLLVKHEDMSMEQMIKDHQKYQSVYEQYARRQWLAQLQVDDESHSVNMSLTIEDLIAIDAIDDIIDNVDIDV